MLLFLRLGNSTSILESSILVCHKPFISKDVDLKSNLMYLPSSLEKTWLSPVVFNEYTHIGALNGISEHGNGFSGCHFSICI